MSGFSQAITCPNCKKGASEYIDNKPFSYVYISCDHCGLVISPDISYQTLKSLNSVRHDAGMTLLKKKPIQNKDLFQ